MWDHTDGHEMAVGREEAMRIEFTLDCNDLDAQARFWAAALGCDVEVLMEGRYIAG
jgi:hypothetical protein